VLSHWLGHPRAHFAITALALVLLLPALGTGLVLDDYVLQLKARGDTGLAGLAAEPWSLFTFTTGDPARNRLLMDEGVLLPWWSDPAHRNAFFRPLSSLSHVLDFTLWPNHPWLMHAHSLLWYAALVLVAAHVYRTLAARSAAAWITGLAVLIYAIDDAHGPTVAWIANRNAILATWLALPAVSSLHRWRAEGFDAGAWLGPMCFALGLCAGETAISVLGYLVAYAICLDRGPWRARALALLPYVALLAAHRVVYAVLGLGSFGSSAYRDPLREPLQFVASLAYNLPVLLSAQLGARFADLAFWGDPDGRVPLWAASVLTLAALAWLAWPLLRRDAHARFWALGMGLAAIPVSASVPGERLLLCIGVGAAPLTAQLVRGLFDRGESHVREGWLARLLVLGVALGHLVAPAVALPVRALAMGAAGAVGERIDQSVPRDARIADKTLIVVNAPYNAAVSYLQPMRVVAGAPRPARVHWLASASSELSVMRTASDTLRVTLAQGFLRRPEETHYRGDVTGLAVGTRVSLSDLDVEVVSVTSDGRPKAVDFRFTHALSSTRYVFMCYRNGRLEPWRPPALGGGERFPAQDFFEVVLSEVMR
jgi:hypothetical protein